MPTIRICFGQVRLDNFWRHNFMSLLSRIELRSKHNWVGELCSSALTSNSIWSTGILAFAGLILEYTMDLMHKAHHLSDAMVIVIFCVLANFPTSSVANNIFLTWALAVFPRPSLLLVPTGKSVGPWQWIE